MFYIFGHFVYICPMIPKNEIIKSQIVEASKSVFRRYGYRKVSMEDIAKACGKGRSTIYYYFKNKQEVLEEVALQEYMSITEPAAKQVIKEKSISENLFQYNQVKLKSLVRKTEEYDHLFTDIKEDPEFLQRMLHRVRHNEIQLIKTCLEWAMEKEEIAPVSRDDLEFLAMAIVTAAGSLEKEMLLYGSIDDMSNRLPWLTSLLIKGLK